MDRSARLVYWNGYYTEDAPGYVTDAIWAALGNYHARDNVNGLNVGTYLPVALPIWLFGKSEIALSLWPLSCSLLGLVSLAGAERYPVWTAVRVCSRRSSTRRIRETCSSRPLSCLMRSRPGGSASPFF